MALPSWARQTVVILAPGVTLDRGEETEDWTNPTRTVVTGCSVQPGQGDRDMSFADGVTAAFTVYLPPEVSVDPRARVEVPGVEGQFLILGEPQQWLGPQRTSHVRIYLRRRDG